MLSKHNKSHLKREEQEISPPVTVGHYNNADKIKKNKLWYIKLYITKFFQCEKKNSYKIKKQ